MRMKNRILALLSVKKNGITKKNLTALHIFQTVLHVRQRFDMVEAELLLMAQVRIRPLPPA